MTKSVSFHFKFKGRLYSLNLKTTVENTSLANLEERLCEKLGLDERKVKLVLRYPPMVIGCDELQTICDDEDVFVYLTSVDKHNRKCVLFVEDETNREEQLEKLSRADKSSFGGNFETVQENDDVIGGDAIVLYVENGQANQHEANNDNDDGGMDEDTAFDETAPETDTGADMETDGANKYVEPPPLEQSSQFLEEWDDGLAFSKFQEFENKKAIQEAVDRAAYQKCFRFVTKKSDTTLLVLKCCEASCKWGLRAARIRNTGTYSIRRYNGLHSCSRTSQSKESTSKRRGSANLVACWSNEEYPREIKTPAPRDIMRLMKLKLGVTISYSTASRGRNLALSNMLGSSEESYKMLYSYLYMLESVNPGTKTSVKLDEAGKFKYLFIALGACIEGFKVMRKVIVVDATFLKNGYGGVLVFAKAQDPNRHHYPLAIGVLDGENNASWTWFMEMLKSVIPDSPEIVFMSDRNQSIITAVQQVYPEAHHGHCIWHLAQNVRAHASNTSKAVVAWRFMEVARYYTRAAFDKAYASFKVRYPSAYQYVEKHTEKETWARVFFPRDRYNLDTSNSVESMNSAFNEARRLAVIPMLDAIITQISKWFNEHRKDAVSASTTDTKLVPLVENHLHNLWGKAEKTPVRELNSYELEYEITDIDDGKLYLVNLVAKSCTCKVFDYEKYLCLHGLAVYIHLLGKDAALGRRLDVKIEYHELCSEYYWITSWVRAYQRTIYYVPPMCDWNVPDYVKEKGIIPKDRLKSKGRKNNKRNPLCGERKPQTQNSRRPRQNFVFNWLMFDLNRDPVE